MGRKGSGSKGYGGGGMAIEERELALGLCPHGNFLGLVTGPLLIREEKTLDYNKFLTNISLQLYIQSLKRRASFNPTIIIAL